MAENAVTLIGNLTQNLELRYAQSGKARVSVGVAVNRRWNKDGVWQEQTSFFNLVMWDEMAENAAATLSKGTRVVVAGRIEQRTWEVEGEKKTTIEIMVDDIGPSLRWATADVKKTAKKGAKGNKADEYEEEPF